ncbi:hypothetical protein QTQ03_22675 [Micromonospora sp. WMMA1363]|uniref:hypothetical protein n=1 Tax=Micromonospora sp. WMMA1363 TaxID=3053985 RepID=UPI00259C8583|nr:hypothetical protein [Micromonospora sp. WMMA1363]MDM4722254.1 hypothetical protein [Micromonospora sp. WMMA1363]
MSGRQKILLAVVALALVAFYAIALGTGTNSQGDPGARPRWVDWLGGAFGGNSVVDPSTVTADCSRAGDILTFADDCHLVVQDPGSLETLILRSSAAFVVQAPTPGDSDTTARQEVTPSPTASAAATPTASAVGGATPTASAAAGTAVAKIAVDRETRIALSCVGADECTVTIASS